ncbi:MAG: DUF3276 family protein [Rectinemataceae bacterium]
MGIRGELFSTKFNCEGRTYFFNVKQNRNGDLFLTVVESKPTETETFDRRSIVVFNENLEGFMRALRTAAGYMEKAGQHGEQAQEGSRQEYQHRGGRHAEGKHAESMQEQQHEPRRFSTRRHDADGARTPRQPASTTGKRIIVRRKSQSDSNPGNN